MSLPSFSQRLLKWFDVHGRHDLPWQHPREPYRVWVSEIMLQQTQVSTVIPYFKRFMQRFPSVRALAQASEDEVLSHWAGLGYYARGRNLHRAAKLIVEQHGGEIPPEIDALMALPGIGRSTAGAILSQAMGQAHPVLDGNVRRVIARHRAIEGWPGDPAVQKPMWEQAQDWLPQTRAADYTQAIMDLGNLVCTRRRPRCDACPVRYDCQALKLDRTDEFPASKPRRERPTRRRTLLIIENAAQHVLIQRRPPAGIWGGLWSVPMGEDEESARELADRYGANRFGRSELPPIRHALTHFELHLLPVHAKYDEQTLIIRDDGSSTRWLDLEDPSQWPGLPAPIRALLEQMRQHALELVQTP